MTSNTITVIVAAFGATTGAISLISQWWSNRFKLAFERVVLRYESGAIEALQGRSAEQLDNSFMIFEVEIEVLNLASGRGSVEKPRLEVQHSDGAKLIQYPETQERKSEPIHGQPGAHRIWVERWGNSYSIAPRERLDDALNYPIDFDEGEKFLPFVEDFDRLSFFLLYRDHRGHEQRREITEIVGVDDLL